MSPSLLKRLALWVFGILTVLLAAFAGLGGGPQLTLPLLLVAFAAPFLGSKWVQQRPLLIQGFLALMLATAAVAWLIRRGSQ